MKIDFEYNKFRENIRSIIQEEFVKLIKQHNLYVTYSATVVSAAPKTTDNPFEQRCGVDLVFTQVKDLLNKTGQVLQEGDSVIIYEKAGSNFSNCFIAYKNN